MISVEQATKLASDSFPNGPEELSAHLGITIHETPLDGCDGWCLSDGDKAIIRLNDELSPGRKRFTLAHELGHIILGVPTIVGETYEDMFKSDSEEERRVNSLASSLLLPIDVVKKTLSDLPVVAGTLKKLAIKAKISELATAVSVCNLASEIGLDKAWIVLFDGKVIRWQWSKFNALTEKVSLTLLDESRKTFPAAFRYTNSESDNAIVASIIENPFYGTSTLFVQKLPAEIGMNQTIPEKRKELEQYLFADDIKYQQQMSGLLGAWKNRIIKDCMTQEQAEADFWNQYKQRLENTPFNSKQGRDYVHLRISEWY